MNFGDELQDLIWLSKDQIIYQGVKTKLTPMLDQFLNAKSQNPDNILLFRMGDFYETFFNDAKIISKELDLTLTSRNKNDDENEVPMAGIPVRTLDDYLFALVEKGYNVSVCDQLEDPASAVGIVKRGITQIVTPGTLLDLRPGTEKNTRLLTAIAWNKDNPQNPIIASIASIDLSNANASVTEFASIHQLSAELLRLNIREIITNDLQQTNELNLEKKLQLQPIIRPDLEFDTQSFLNTQQSDNFKSLCNKIQKTNFLYTDLAQNALTALFNYLIALQNNLYSSITDINTYKIDEFMLIDASTFQNLEIYTTMRQGQKKGSLLYELDECVTPMGSRLLRQWLAYPLKDLSSINQRLDAVDELKNNYEIQHTLRQLLSQLQDLERLTTKIASQKNTPKDLHNLRLSLDLLPQITLHLAKSNQPLLKKLQKNIDPCNELRTELASALVDDPPTNFNDAPVIRENYAPELDRLKSIANSGQQWLLEYETKQKKITGINSLKIKYQRIFGYFIEVTKANLSLVPDNYIRKQTLTNAERFYTPELKEYEEDLLHAEDQKNTLELELFKQLCDKANQYRSIILKNAQIIARIDLLSSFAHTAQQRNYTRPTLDESNDLILVEARHPVVERSLPKNDRFVPTDLEVLNDSARLLIITGPNMGGKSTIIRQAAIITLMAQIGSFVPANFARIGIVDQIFSRVGASDNLSLGQSTFMLEMTETANILQNATDKSLIILDEIGRGTSTYDGLSLAKAIAEHIHTKIQARALFATHYHELTELELTHDAIQNCSVAVKEWEHEIIFLRKLLKSPANRSYGIQVAKLAGIPHEVIQRAENILEQLEIKTQTFLEIQNEENQDSNNKTPTNIKPSQKLLFAKSAPKPTSPQSPIHTALIEEIKKLSLDTTSPIVALNLLYKWQKKLKIHD